MNYLAHLHLADVTQTSATGSLLGDFVKGQVANLDYSDEIKQGIRLHRAVDTFTDNHPLILKLKAELGAHRRYGGIILDVLFDHHLALNFSRLHSNSLAVFARHIYRQIDFEDADYPERYRNVCRRMIHMNWLEGYTRIENIERALVGISNRLSRPVDLAASLTWHSQHRVEFEQTFLQFYVELQDFARQFVK